MKSKLVSSVKWQLLFLVVLLLVLPMTAQQDQQLPEAPKPQNNAPAPAPAQLPPAPSTSKPAPPPPAFPKDTAPAPAQPAPSAKPAPVQPMPTVPEGGAPDVPGSPRNKLFTLTKNVNFVLVPATVKDSSGRLVNGLVERDFSVYEDGVKQNITFFTSDPFPLSAAVVLDTALPDTTWRKVRETLSALVGAFSQFDEVTVFTYGNTVRQMQDFAGVDAARLEASVRKLKRESGSGGVPVVGGPMGGGRPSPNVNGVPLEPNTPQIATMPKESYVLNDAILQAAIELGKRDQTRRRIIFVISDGREVGSHNSYSDVLRVLLTRQIAVYAINVGGGGIPGYRELQKIRIPGQGYGDILPKYASATGGEVFAELGQKAVEQAYARVTEEARNQYTIGYNTRATASGAYRSVEVRVARPNLRIFARDGYFPLPPGK